MKKLLFALLAVASISGVAYAEQTTEDALARLEEVTAELIALDEKGQLTPEEEQARVALVEEVQRLQEEVEAAVEEQA